MTTDAICSSAAAESAAVSARTVWKFPISLPGHMDNVPRGGRLLFVGLQGEDLIGWVLVDPDAERVTRLVHIYGTGHPVPPERVNDAFIGTVFMGPYVFHFFDGGERVIGESS